MSYIYKITNDINDKVYIGKTESSIEKRFREHCRDAFKKRNEKRPLYNAMKKYGIEHFTITLIEECSKEKSSEREIYWIDYYEGYTKGYNGTKGGDGKSYIDEKEIFSLWEQGFIVKEIALQTHHSEKQISTILRNGGITKDEILNRSRKKYSNLIAMLDKDTEEILQVFPSQRQAVKFLLGETGCTENTLGGYAGHIGDACLGKRKTCLGYKWKYIEDE